MAHAGASVRACWCVEVRIVCCACAWATIQTCKAYFYGLVLRLRLRLEVHILLWACGIARLWNSGLVLLTGWLMGWLECWQSSNWAHVPLLLLSSIYYWHCLSVRPIAACMAYRIEYCAGLGQFHFRQRARLFSRWVSSFGCLPACLFSCLPVGRSAFLNETFLPNWQLTLHSR